MKTDENIKEELSSIIKSLLSEMDILENKTIKINIQNAVENYLHFLQIWKMMISIILFIFLRNYF